MNRRTPPWAAAGLLLAASLAAQTPVALRFEPGQPAIPGGHSVVVVVTAEHLAGAEEFELLLRTQNLKIELVRLTPSSFQTCGSLVTITVPHLPWAEARLELRAGSGGREWTVASSQPFVILPQARRPLQRLVFRQGEWWPDATTSGRAFGPPGAVGLQKDQLWRWQQALLLPKGSRFATRPSETAKNAQPRLYLLATASGVLDRWRPTINFPKRE